MSRVYFISDLHLGHKHILDFVGDKRGGLSVDEHDEWIIDQWNSTVNKNDTVYVLGDIAFSRESLEKCSRLRGNRHAILGNHDRFKTEEYMQHFRIRPGLVKYKGFWLSHAPIHPAELRGCKNIHGHVHLNTIPDDRYINVCVEQSYGKPVPFTKISGVFN